VWGHSGEGKIWGGGCFVVDDCPLNTKDETISGAVSQGGFHNPEKHGIRRKGLHGGTVPLKLCSDENARK